MKSRLLVLGLACALLAALLPACARTPQAAPIPGPTPTGDLTTIAVAYVQALAKGEYATAAALSEAKMNQAFPAAKMQETWQALVAQFGAFQKLGGTRTEQQAPYDYVYVTCEFEQAALDAKVVLDVNRRVTGLWFGPHQASVEYQTPTYVRSGAFSEQELTIGSGPLALPATLTLPEGTGPFPAVVLVQGSGPNDRDETVGANKPFRDLAWGLASRGVAVLRYEKRTKAHPEQLVAIKDTMTVKEESVDDALAAVALLRTTAGIAPQRVFVLGHSLGGTLAPRIGLADPQIAGLVVLAGATRPLPDLVLEQTAYLANLDGSISPDEQQSLDEIKRQVDQINDPALASQTGTLLDAPISYWLDLRNYHPAETATAVKAPMLILQGARDYQVTTEDLEGWKKALSSRDNVQFKLYPALNHLFMTGEGKSTPAEYDVAGHVAEEVVADTAAWINQH